MIFRGLWKGHCWVNYDGVARPQNYRDDDLLRTLYTPKHCRYRTSNCRSFIRGLQTDPRSSQGCIADLIDVQPRTPPSQPQNPIRSAIHLGTNRWYLCRSPPMQELLLLTSWEITAEVCYRLKVAPTRSVTSLRSNWEGLYVWEDQQFAHSTANILIFCPS